MPSLAPIFRDKLIPWASSDLEQRLVVARPVMKKGDVPYDVGISRKQIDEKRVLVRKWAMDVERFVSARWPKAGLHELKIFKLVCVTKGVTDYQAGEYLITCNEGHFILLPPHTANTTGGRSHLEGEHRLNGSCEILQLILLPDNVQCTLCVSQGEEHYETANCIVRNPHVRLLFELFVEEALTGSKTEDVVMHHVLSSLFAMLAREVGEERVWTKRPAAELPVGGQMRRLRDYIESHLTQSLTIEKAAQHMYMSPSQFTRYVRRETGQSFVQLLTEYRIKEAKLLLRERDWTVAAVARQVGFKSVPYFITLFGRQEGCSPSEYRSNIKIYPKK